jgi:histidinol-phosphate/aromatic aminotransferase/cobyric acid decarboxylase-like protein
VRLKPDEASVHLGLGNALYAQKSYQATVDEAREAVRLKPKDAEAAAMAQKAVEQFTQMEERVNHAHTQLAQEASPAKEPKEANFILINTCSVREKPEHKVYSALGRYKWLKGEEGNDDWSGWVRCPAGGG